MAERRDKREVGNGQQDIGVVLERLVLSDELFTVTRIMLLLCHYSLITLLNFMGFA